MSLLLINFMSLLNKSANLFDNTLNSSADFLKTLMQHGDLESVFSPWRPFCVVSIQRIPLSSDRCGGFKEFLTERVTVEDLRLGLRKTIGDLWPLSTKRLFSSSHPKLGRANIEQPHNNDWLEKWMAKCVSFFKTSNLFRMCWKIQVLRVIMEGWDYSNSRLRRWIFFFSTKVC